MKNGENPRIEPLMPADPVRGRRWADHRGTLEAIAWKYRTNSPWRDLPEELGSFQTAHPSLRRESPPLGGEGIRSQDCSDSRLRRTFLLLDVLTDDRQRSPAT
ncbi:transposase [Streptomyces sp. NBC_01613]